MGIVIQRVGFLPSLHARSEDDLESTAWSTASAWVRPTWATSIMLRILGLFGRELFAVRGRRLYAIAKLTIQEANRRMWAPWVVLVVFGLILAFTHWFLIPPRAAEMGRLFVGTLTLLCSLLLTVMVTLLTPLSLPTDIQNQTIYTVVSKPVRRLELVWGRMLGFMALVTVLIVVFGGVSLFYL